MAKMFITTEHATGKRFYGERKQSWNHIYYRFGGDQWHRSKLVAFRSAQANGTLSEVSDVVLAMIEGEKS